MVITVSNVLTVENSTTELKQWCKKNLVLANQDYIKKSRMGFYIGDTPRYISLYEVRGDELILPYGTLSLIPKEITANALIISDFSPSEAIDYQSDISLYDYQKDAVEVMIRAKYGILQSPPGSGKTQMGIALAIALKRKMLWLCHTLDLVKQSKERAEQYIDKNLIGTISEGKVDIGKGMTFATVQTMCRLDLQRYKDEWDVIIVDEVHRVSGSPTRVTQYQKVLNNLSARHKYGLSATVHRSDGMIEATYALVGKIAYSVPKEAVADKIMQVGIKEIDTGIQESRECLNTDGTINYTKLISYLTENKERNLLIAHSIEVGKSSLILSDRLEQLNILKDILPYGELDKAVMISGKTDKLEREKALDEMRKGNKKYLFATYSLCKEGLDIPRLERLYMATPVKDYAVVTQSIGRIARTCEGKSDPICYDFVDNIAFLDKAKQTRRRHYKKEGCYFIDNG